MKRIATSPLSVVKMFCAVLLLVTAAVIAAPAQTLTSLVSFNSTDGREPDAEALVQGLDGNLYGTTRLGGTFSEGTVFKISPTGTLTTLWNF